MNSNVIELVVFKLAQGSSSESFLEAARKSRSVLEKMEGFISRTLCVGNSENEWVDIVQWQNIDFALSAASKFPQEVDAQQFMSMIDEQSIVMRHINIVKDA